jgi:hypothetical protein
MLLQTTQISCWRSCCHQQHATRRQLAAVQRSIYIETAPTPSNGFGFSGCSAFTAALSRCSASAPSVSQAGDQHAGLPGLASALSPSPERESLTRLAAATFNCTARRVRAAIPTNACRRASHSRPRPTGREQLTRFLSDAAHIISSQEKIHAASLAFSRLWYF